MYCQEKKNVSNKQHNSFGMKKLNIIWQLKGTTTIL